MTYTITTCDKYNDDSIEIEYTATEVEYPERCGVILEPLKVFFKGRDITNRIEFSDRNKGTDYWTEVVELINSKHK